MSFDPNTFLTMTVEEANDTKISPCPAGEYLAVATKVEPKSWASRDGSSSGMKLEITWDIDDANVKQLLGREKVTSRQNIMLDLNEAGNGLDMGKGKNVGLGRLREVPALAIRQRAASATWRLTRIGIVGSAMMAVRFGSINFDAACP